MGTFDIVKRVSRHHRIVILFGFFAAISGCGLEPVSAPDVGPTSTNISFKGSVGDGTASGATVSVFDGNGQKVAEVQADNNALFDVSVPNDVVFPLQLTVVGGNGVIGNANSQLVMSTFVFDSSNTVINISLLSTLALETSQCGSNAPSKSNFSFAMDQVVGNLGMGYDSAVLGDPSTTVIDTNNIVPFAVANIGLYEAIRRTSVALSGAFLPTSESDIMTSLACDIADGSLDGAGNGVDPRIAVTYLTASAAVMVEIGAHQLLVDGVQAEPLIDSAVQSVLPNSSGVPSASDLAPADIVSQQSNKPLQMSRFMSSDVSIIDYLISYGELRGAELSTALDTTLSPANRTTLAAISQLSAGETNTRISAAVSILQQIDGAVAPSVVLSPTSSSVPLGTSVELVWSSQDTDRCLAKGDWSGEMNTSGTTMSMPINSTAAFSLGCVGLAGATSRSVVVTVAGSNNLPQISFSASSLRVSSGDSVTLNWSVSSADSCTASGAWSGTKALTGNETVGPLTTSSQYVLACSSVTGTSQQTVNVIVGGGSQGEYARGVPYPDFGWDPLTYNPATSRTLSSLPETISGGDVILYTGTNGGTVRFNCVATAPCVLRGNNQTLTSGLIISGDHFIVEGFKFFNTEYSVAVVGDTRSAPAAFGVVRSIDHGGDNSGSSNGVSMSTVNSHDIVYYQNNVHNLQDDSGASEVDYIGYVPRHNANNIWYLENLASRLGGDGMRTGTNVSRIGAGNIPPTNIYIAGNQFSNMGENPIDLKYSTDIVLSSNQFSGASTSVSSSGEAIVLHESADNVFFYDNHIFNVVRGIVTATSGGGARYILVDGNLFENISGIGVYNRGGGHADVTNNIFRNVADPINNNSNNGSSVTESGNTFE